MFSSMRITAIGDFLGGVLILGAAVPRVDVDWTPSRLTLLVLAPLVGMSLFALALWVFSRASREYQSSGH